MNLHRVFDFNDLIQPEQQDLPVVQNISNFLVGFIVTCFKITLGGLLAGGMLFLLEPLIPAHSSLIPVLSAYSAAAAVLYIASLSGALHPRDFFAMIVPGFTIWGLLMSDINNGLLLGFSLFTHTLTGFYGTLSKPRGAIQELGLWPLLLGFNGIILSFWALTF